MGRPKKEKKVLTPEEKAAAARLKIVRDEDKQKLEERREREFAMWLGGASFRQIAAQVSSVGEAISKSTVEKDINQMLDREIKQNPDDDKFFLRTRRKVARQLEDLVLPFMVKAKQGNVREAELLVKIFDKIVDITGSKRPTKFEHDHNFDPKELSDEELQRVADSKSAS